MKNKKMIYIFAVTVFVLAISFGLYKYLNNNKNNISNTTNESSDQAAAVDSEGVPPAKPSPSGG